MNRFSDRVATRQADLEGRLDRRWQPETSEPVLCPGTIRYELSDRVRAVPWGGLGTLETVVKAVGLPDAIDSEVSVFARHRPYHESDHVLNLVYLLATGGESLGELDFRRRSDTYLDALGADPRIPASSTAGDFLRRFDSDSVRSLMDAANSCSAKIWQRRSKKDRSLARIDVDGTIVETGGLCKEGQGLSYDGRWGFGPLIVSLANSREVLYAVNRAANRPSHDGVEDWIALAVRWARKDAGFEAVRLRGDTDFALTKAFDGWTDDGVEFVFGIDRNPSFIRRARTLDEEAWRPFDRSKRPRKTSRKRPRNVRQEIVEQRGYRDLRLVEEHVAEVQYRPKKCRKDYRMVFLRKRIKVTQGQLELDDEIRYHVFATNVPPESLSTAAVVREAHARCDQENIIEQLKNGLPATRMPVRQFDANWAYLAIGAIAWNLKAWLGLIIPPDQGGEAILRMKAQRFLREVVLAAAQVVTTARYLTFRLLDVNPQTGFLLDAPLLIRRWAAS